MSGLRGGILRAIVGGLVLAGGCRGGSQVSLDPGDGGAGPGEGAVPAGEAPPVVDTWPPPGWEAEPPRWRPAGRDPRLVWRVDGEGGELGFVERLCAQQGSCGCERASEHRYAREGGRWKITVITPDITIREKVVRGTCGVGCGTQAPPVPVTVRSLGAVAPEDVEVVEMHPRKVVTVTTCTNPIPVP